MKQDAITKTEITVKEGINALQEAILKPHYECNSQGIFYIGIKTDKEGNTSETAPIWLADPIELIGIGKDHAQAYHRIISYKDKISRRPLTQALAMAELGTQQGWQHLKSLGIAIASQRSKREKLDEYLQTHGSRQTWQITNKAGWHNQAYILPSGEILAKEEQAAQSLIYNGDKSQAHAYQASGTLEQWQQEIAQYAQGNSRLLLAIGTALAAPLLKPLHMESGGFHLYGDSRDGKTTIAKAALSVWGNPEAAKLTWSGTALGINNTAAARNDGLLVLDEIGQANARHVANIAYSLINGTSKLQGSKDGGNRELTHWQNLLLSTGEKTLESYLGKHGEDWNAGQAARLPALPSHAGKGLGVYDHLHHFHKGSELSEHLLQAAQQYHGTLGRAWIALLQQPHAIAEAKQHQDAFMRQLPSQLDGQARTVALRFALVYAALELATPITGLPAGDTLAGIKQCFNDWLAITGTGKREDKIIIEQASDFFQQHAHGMRFTDWNDKHTNQNHAGYRKENRINNTAEYWVNTPTFRLEICGTFEPNKVCEVLNAIGWLDRPQSGRGWQHKKAGSGNHYKFNGATPPEESEP